MSLFKERSANAKKVIALQNEIFSLKNQLSAQAKEPNEQDCCSEDLCCEELSKQKERNELLELSSKDLSDQLDKLKVENKKLKASLKKATKKSSSKEE